MRNNRSKTKRIADQARRKIDIEAAEYNYRCKVRIRFRRRSKRAFIHLTFIPLSGDGDAVLRGKASEPNWLVDDPCFNMPGHITDISIDFLRKRFRFPI